MSASRRRFIATAGLGAVCAAVTPAAVATAAASSGTGVDASTARATGLSTPPPALPVASPSVDTGVRLDPRDFGAKGDGATKDTEAFQTALDRCAVLGGGEVVVAAGTWLIGAIRIGSNTKLRLDAAATLLGSPDLADYPVRQIRWEGRWIPGHIGLVWAQDAHDIAIAGQGRIVGSAAIPGRVDRATGLRHPALLEFVECRTVTITDVRTEQNDMWSIHPVYCEDVIFRGLSVRGGADGVDVDSCRRVLIERCDFDTADDCISLKSGRGMEGALIGRPTEDVTILDCSFRDRDWACIGIGSETSAGVRRVLVERCRCLSAHTFAIYIKSRPGRGAFIEDIVMRDLEVSGVGHGFLRLNILDSGKQDQFPVGGLDGVPTIRNFAFERITVRDVPVLVEAVNIHPDKPLDGFVFRDVTGTAGRGLTLTNMRNADIGDVRVRVASGPLLAIDNVSGRGLDGASPLTPTVRPVPVEVVADYRLGMSSGRPN
jgi:polygalacturonase